MKTVIFITLALLASATHNAFAAGDPCAAVLCLSHNDKLPWECKGAVDGYFDIREYFRPCKKCGWKFDPPQAAARRYREVLERCEGVEAKDREKIHALYGQMEYSPFEYAVTAKSDSPAPSKVVEDEIKKTVTRVYYTCSGAAADPKWAGKIEKPSARAKAVPNGTRGKIWLNEYSSVIVKAENGYLSWPLYDKDQTLHMYGFASYDNTETINVRTKEVLEFKSENVAYNTCAMRDPSIFGDY